MGIVAIQPVRACDVFVIGIARSLAAMDPVRSIGVHTIGTVPDVILEMAPRLFMAKESV